MTTIPETDTPESVHFLDLTRADLAARLAEWGEPHYRADQLLDWVYTKRIDEFEAMTNLSQALRRRLSQTLRVFESVISRRRDAGDGTTKLLLQWRDGATTECVLIPDGERRTACISTQVGCPVGCVFCASGLDGLERQLSPGQIVEQAMRVAQLCGEDERLSNVVFMGLGEPLANYQATVHAVRTLNAAWGMGLGARKITVSTVGLPGPMKKLADEGLQITLALSLHAPDDELRKQLIPWAERVSIDHLVEAGRYYFDRTGREVTLEYILLDGVNDGPAHARSLSRVAKKMRCNVNLIPYNPVSGLGYGRPADEAVQAFYQVLRQVGINTHVRRSRGLDVDAACGQLRRREREQTVFLNRNPSD